MLPSPTPMRRAPRPSSPKRATPPAPPSVELSLLTRPIVFDRAHRPLMVAPMRQSILIAAVAVLGLGSCAAPLARTPAVATTATYTNPVIDADFPDPTVIRAPDGLYYAYATQSQREGKWVNIQLARSSDLVHWTYLGDALPNKPAWASTTQDFWAPHVQRAGARYIMYYSA